MSCAYQFGSVKRGIPGGYDKISVPVFSNKTPEAGIESFFTRSMIEEIERAHMAQVTVKDLAQVVLEGEIRSIQTVHGAQVTRDTPGFQNLPNRAVLTKEFRLVVTVDMKLRRKSDDLVLWSGQFVGEQRYAAPQVTGSVLNTVNPLYNNSARYQTVSTIARDLMAEAHDRMTENF